MFAWVGRHKFLVLNVLVVVCLTLIAFARMNSEFLSKDSANGLVAMVVFLRILASAFLK